MKPSLVLVHAVFWLAAGLAMRSANCLGQNADSPSAPVDEVLKESDGREIQDVLSQPWSSSGPINWPIASALAAMSRDVYLPMDEAEAAFRQRGFEEARWIEVGSMAVVVAKRDGYVVIVFRGTKDFGGWLTNLKTQMIEGPSGKLHAGFAVAYKSIRSEARTAARLDEADRVWVTGHSLGGALALLCAEDLLDDFPKESLGVATFGQPMIADPSGAAHIDKRLVGRYQRFVNGQDVVPRIPPNYAHAGDRVWLHDGKAIREHVIGAQSRSSPINPPAEPPRPLTANEFRAMQNDLRRTRESRRSEVRPVQGSFTWFQDHAIALYVEHVDALKAALASEKSR